VFYNLFHIAPGKNVLFGLALGMCVGFSTSLSAASPKDSLGTESPPSERTTAGAWFSLLGHTFEGDFLFIRYKVRYPGMVKIKMYDIGDRLLWRSQYVNAVEGEHKIVLRSKFLVSGETYIFEFDYKSHKERFTVTI